MSSGNQSNPLVTIQTERLYGKKNTNTKRWVKKTFLNELFKVHIFVCYMHPTGTMEKVKKNTVSWNLENVNNALSSDRMLSFWGWC